VDIGQAIRLARQRQHMTQAALARRIGVHPKTVGKWENEGQVPAQHFGALEEVLGIQLINREPLATSPTELSQMTYSELLNLLMRITAELARRGEPASDGGASSPDWTRRRIP